MIALDSVTHLTEAHRGGVAVCASHGGVYAAWVVATAGLRAVVLHDAGVGRDGAGIAGLAWLEPLGMPAAALAHDSCRIGDGADCVARGRVGHANAAAGALGVVVGMPCRDAVACLEAAPVRTLEPAPIGEARRRIDAAGRDGVVVWALDSNGLVLPADAGHVIVTGSHGGLLGGDPQTACKADVWAALYNDAGVGIDAAGVSRLPALDARGIAAATVDAWTARIGDAMSTYADGIVSCVNATAACRGGRVGTRAAAWVEAMVQAKVEGTG